LAFGKEFVTIFNYLMGSANEIHVVFLEEFGYYIRAKGVTYTTIVFVPTGNIFVGIGPE
jgi:hypothetical protein